ncbi:S-adenosyl-L-methionine-dependent methyltransferase [Mycotypha africana]|uniref:S-adenosyl-L-methionine-dependent methyltransferase n=1 Tax=Mycotypha africana TaxID=64632 RepID=UPI00230194A9|nr:S-adenosyl-L-methionine-dependent methyltransferase [Mycotypha africana]KAI8979308.1 S-adenosyl-L-methionine-dependent methyltransferase [Mycotypha africana]
MTNKPVRILDLCTGTGCISLALAKKLPKNTVEITGIDISAAAIALAKENFALHKESLNNPVTFEQKDIFQLDSHDVEPYQLFVSNPPYVTHDEYATLEPCVRDWEDKRALVADEQGTSIHKRIIDLSRHSKPYAENTPYVFMEIGGAHQVKVLMQTMQQAGLHNISIWKDLADRDRVIVGY